MHASEASDDKPRASLPKIMAVKVSWMYRIQNMKKCEQYEISGEARTFNRVEPCGVNRGFVFEHSKFFKYHRLVVETRGGGMVCDPPRAPSQSVGTSTPMILYNLVSWATKSVYPHGGLRGRPIRRGQYAD